MTSGRTYPFDLGSTVSARYWRIATFDSGTSWLSWYEVEVLSCP